MSSAAVMFGAVMSFVLAAGVLVLIAKPLLVPPFDDEGEEASEFRSQKEKVLEEIRDLDMDFAAGKLSEEDYRQLRASSVVEAAQVMRQIEDAEAALVSQRTAAASAAESEENSGGASSLDLDEEDDIEAEIRARRDALRAKREGM